MIKNLNFHDLIQNVQNVQDVRSLNLDTNAELNDHGGLPLRHNDVLQNPSTYPKMTHLAVIQQPVGFESMVFANLVDSDLVCFANLARVANLAHFASLNWTRPANLVHFANYLVFGFPMNS
jgi:hypothetical protein